MQEIKRHEQAQAQSDQPGLDWIHFTHQLQRLGTALFNQQCWLWSQDIRRVEGNLLIEYGFSRRRPPEHAPGSSVYRLPINPNVMVALWAFGAFYGSATEGGVYLGRYAFAPAWVASLDEAHLPHMPDALAIVSQPRSYADHQRFRLLLVDMLRWIGAYEQWVVETIGLDYRRECVATWTRGPQTPAERVVTEWRNLAAYCERRVAGEITSLDKPRQHYTGATLTMPYADKTIICRDCGEPFVFTAGEQEFYAQKGFTNEPTRCATCRQARKQAAGQGGGYSRSVGGYGGGGYGGGGGYSRNSSPREMYTVPCSEPGCKIDAVVPFKPRGDKPVYCDECFQKQRRGNRY
jgi:CxxC-x17-CxxC domain-containing protein